MRVLVDANILFSRTLRDWLLMLQLESGGDVYTTYWTEDILAEVVYRLRRANPTWPGGTLTRLRDKIAATLEGGRVEDFTVDGSFGGDPDDQHVHAAALACGADIVLTSDNGFCIEGRRARLPYEVVRPDRFFVLVDDVVPGVVAAVAADQARHFRQRRDVDLCARLEAAGCPDFAVRVRSHLQSADTSDR